MLRCVNTTAEHVTNDVCFIPIMGGNHLETCLPARPRFSRLYDTDETRSDFI